MIEVEYSQRTTNSIYGYEKGKVGKKMYLATTIGVVNQYRTKESFRFTKCMNFIVNRIGGKLCMDQY